MYCNICGKENPVDAKFCHSCGGGIGKAISKPDQVLPQSAAIPGKYSKAPLGNRFGAAILDALIVFGLALPAIILFFVAIAKLSDYWVMKNQPMECCFLPGYYTLHCLYRTLLSKMVWAKVKVGERKLQD